MKKKKELSKEDLIAVLEKRVQDPNISPRDLASLSKRLANLKGFVKQGVYVRSSQPQPDQPEPEALPKWWSDSWCRIFIAERACGSSGGFGRWTHELDQFESEWAKREGLSVEQLREALRHEHAEWKAQTQFGGIHHRPQADWR